MREAGVPLSALRDSGLSFWRRLEEDEAGLGELTFS